MLSIHVRRGAAELLHPSVGLPRCSSAQRLALAGAELAAAVALEVSAMVKKADGSVDLVNTSNAATPLTSSDKALLTVDVWEHAYYIDYRNARPKFVETFLNSLVNWEFAAQNFA